ncbi:phosphate signaling complex protein PhoU [Desulfovermiculus halophilus]|jgi:phosphate transport system protein|uniref:phosphate signaling complex protein PhoU n=1 Tax=Desulfovermiculus halophilus TaxID=339722 RepID=UPI00047FB0DD|nr:phosphate signaling complex protein PhoU [Desulfovermiculus halophilus]
METHLHKELEKLEVKMMRMFTLTERALGAAVKALMERNDSLAEEVIVGDKEINALEVDIEEAILHILALWQPVAKDLRFVMGCSKIANDLERLGDQATNVAERAIMLNQRPRLALMSAVQSLADISLSMYQNVIDAFSRLDCDQAAQVCGQDNTADDLNIKIIRRLIDSMSSENAVVERAVHTVIVANSLERVGDLSTNIAENIYFIVQGINVKHSDRFDSKCS